jgi:hypothetical protein
VRLNEKCDERVSQRVRELADRLTGWFAATMLVIAAPIIGFLTGLASDFGRHVDPRVFEITAQIAPVIALALVVETAGWVGPMAKRVRKQKRMTSYRSVVLSLYGRVFIGQLVVAEAAALYAVGAQTKTTFLLVTCIATLLAQAMLLVIALEARLGLREPFDF